MLVSLCPCVCLLVAAPSIHRWLLVTDAAVQMSDAYRAGNISELFLLCLLWLSLVMTRDRQDLWQAFDVKEDEKQTSSARKMNCSLAVGSASCHSLTTTHTCLAWPQLLTNNSASCEIKRGEGRGWRPWERGGRREGESKGGPSWMWWRWCH